MFRLIALLLILTFPHNSYATTFKFTGVKIDLDSVALTEEITPSDTDTGTGTTSTRKDLFNGYVTSKGWAVNLITDNQDTISISTDDYVGSLNLTFYGDYVGINYQHNDYVFNHLFSINTSANFYFYDEAGNEISGMLNLSQAGLTGSVEIARTDEYQLVHTNMHLFTVADLDLPISTDNPLIVFIPNKTDFSGTTLPMFLGEGVNVIANALDMALDTVAFDDSYFEQTNAELFDALYAEFEKTPIETRTYRLTRDLDDFGRFIVGLSLGDGRKSMTLYTSEELKQGESVMIELVNTYNDWEGKSALYRITYYDDIKDDFHQTEWASYNEASHGMYAINYKIPRIRLTEEAVPVLQVSVDMNPTDLLADGLINATIIMTGNEIEQASMDMEIKAGFDFSLF